MIGNKFNVCREKLIEGLKENEPLLVLSSLIFVIASLSQTSDLIEISDYAISSSIGFFISLIGSLLLKFNPDNLYFNSLFFSGFIVGFTFIFLILLNFIIEMQMGEIAFQVSMILAVLIFGIVFISSSWDYSISLIKAEKKAKIGFKKKILSVIGATVLTAGLIIYLYSNIWNLFYFYRYDINLFIDDIQLGFAVFLIGLMFYYISYSVKKSF